MDKLINRLTYSLATGIATLITLINPLEASTKIWSGATDNNFVGSDNWVLMDGPPLAGDTAVFGPIASGNSHNPQITNNKFIHVAEFDFTSSSDPYTITITESGNSSELGFFTGIGVKNTSGIMQNFEVINQNTVMNQSALIDFNDNSSADFGNTGLITYSVANGQFELFNSSTLGNAKVSVDGPTALLSSTDSSSLSNGNISAKNSALIQYNSTNPLSTASVNLQSGAQLQLQKPLEVRLLNGDASSVIATSYSTAGPTSLTVNNTTDCAFNGMLSTNNTNDQLIKNGTGKFSLTGDNTNEKLITVNGGELNANTTLKGNVDVNNSGTFSGNAIVTAGSAGTGKISIHSGGKISPGNSISTIFCVDYVQDAGGIYLCEIDRAGNADRIIASNSATLAGILIVDPIDGVNLFTDYIILQTNTANGVSGTFDFVTKTNPLLRQIVIYRPNEVLLSFRQNIESAACTSNERAVSIALDAISNPTNDQLVILDALVNSSVSGTRHALNQISGEQYTYLEHLGSYSDEGLNRRIFNALRNTITPCWCYDPCKSFQTWFQVEEGQSFAFSNNNCKGLRALNWDFTLGGFTTLCDGILLGIAANYEINNVHFYRGGHNRWNAGQGAIYGVYQNECGYLLANIIAGQSWGTMKRPIHFDSINRNAKSNPKVTHGLA